MLVIIDCNVRIIILIEEVHSNDDRTNQCMPQNTVTKMETSFNIKMINKSYKNDQTTNKQKQRNNISIKKKYKQEAITTLQGQTKYTNGNNVNNMFSLIEIS